MTLKYYVAYLGNDNEFAYSLRNYYVEIKTSLYLRTLQYSLGSITDIAIFQNFTIVYIDFSYIKENLADVLEEIRIVKNYAGSKKILFVAMMTEDEADQVDLLLASGIQFIFYKGCDLNLLFQDTIYIQSGKGSPTQNFAKCRSIMCPFEVQHISVLNSFGEESLTLESDYKFSGKNFSFKLPFFPELEDPSFSVNSLKNTSSDFPMTNSYELGLPLSGPWDNHSSKLMSPKKLKTWLGETLVNQEKYQLMIVSKNLNLLKENFLHQNEIPYKLCFKDDHLGEEALERAGHFDPHLIFIDFDEGPEGEIGITSFMDFIKGLQLKHRNPFIVITNSPSSSVALQKISDYSSIVVTKERLCIDILIGISSLFSKKDPLEKKFKPGYSFKTDDCRKVVRISQEINLLDFSEHEISFTSKIEIPFFSVLRCELPVEFYILITPSYRPVGLTIEGEFHYQGIVHGINERNISLLRLFINQIIYAPTTDFSAENLTNMMINICSKKKTFEDSDQFSVVQKKKSEFPFKQTINGKSKL